MADRRNWVFVIACFWTSLTLAVDLATPPTAIQIGGTAGPTRVPPALRRGSFISPSRGRRGRSQR